LPGQRNDEQQYGKADGQRRVADNEQISDPWNEQRIDAQQREHVENAREQSDGKRIVHAERQQCDENDEERNADQLSLRFQIRADALEHVVAQKLKRHF